MEKSSPEKDSFTLNEYLTNLNKEIIFCTKFDENKELKQCSYEKGCHTQELWACLTCYKDKSLMAGICVGCSLECHKDHELAHMYFKRNFRCDCGNSKFGINFF